MKKALLLLTLIFVSSLKGFSSCQVGFSEIIVQITPDNFPTETSWSLYDNSGTQIDTGGAIGDTLCVPIGSCCTFVIHDSYGDGIYAPGGYWIYADGVLQSTGYSFGYGTQVAINCPIGSFCNTPIVLNGAGTYTAPFEDSWYSYTADSTGTYNITTCGLNTCNTQIWVYSSCPAIPYQDNATGTYAYNDDYLCGTQADLNVVLAAGTTYLIRIGDNNNDCTGSIDFALSYVGPVQGCTDPASCNFNPLAVIDDGSCIYPPSPLCDGPDLQIDSLSFLSSLSILTHATQNCDVSEGCVTGYGTRYCLTFTSKINNIGTQDFYIGSPSTQPGMFNLNNCHGHAHYEGYGDYRLFDSNGVLVPAGHKNGFCVIDLCGHGQYTCGNMGISTNCYDAYGAGTQCQWLDITDVPTGDYRVAVIINSKHLPDALGRYETNFANNALQVCMHIEQHVGTAPTYTLLPTCTPFVDCMGIPGGNSELDCNGICNGPGIFGDIFTDAIIDSTDITTYMDMILTNIPATTCYDLNADNELTVFDAQLINWCRNGNPLHPGGTVHNHCNFPRNITNPNDLVNIEVRNLNVVDKCFDVWVTNPNCKVSAFQFQISGATLSSVVSLNNPITLPLDVRVKQATNEVYGISIQDSMLQRSVVPQQLVRVYFTNLTDTMICISEVKEIINQDAERTIDFIVGGCLSTTTTDISTTLKSSEFVIIPNPANDRAFIHVSGGSKAIADFIITDTEGRIVNVPIQTVRDDWYEMDLKDLSTGIYFIIRHTAVSNDAVRLVKF